VCEVVKDYIQDKDGVWRRQNQRRIRKTGSKEEGE